MEENEEFRLFVPGSDGSDALRSFIKGKLIRTVELPPDDRNLATEVEHWWTLAIFPDMLKCALLNIDAPASSRLRRISTVDFPGGEQRGSFTAELADGQQLDVILARRDSVLNYRVVRAQRTMPNGIQITLREDGMREIPLPLGGAPRGLPRQFRTLEELAVYVNAYGRQLRLKRRYENDEKLDGIQLREAIKKLLREENFIGDGWKIQVQYGGGEHRTGIAFTAAPNVRRNLRLYGELRVSSGALRISNLAVY
jgi:hypothetical protein